MKIRKFNRGEVCFVVVISLVLLFSAPVFGQLVDSWKGRRNKRPEVKQIDAAALKEVVKPSGRPLLVNFWATWCEPCREEFPDLVKFAGEYKGRVDFITISLDDLAEIKRDVPAFLASMKAEMPAFLLKTPDEDAAIASLALPWRGALPLSVVYSATGEAAYVRPGKIVPATLKAELDKVLAPKAAEPAQK
jgi:thiol-disulfide isomerase/thioredoxin